MYNGINHLNLSDPLQFLFKNKHSKRRKARIKFVNKLRDNDKRKFF